MKDVTTYVGIDAHKKDLFVSTHLPVGADTIAVTYEANGAATRVSRALPDWNIVMMPTLSYGHGGANQIGNMPIHPGTRLQAAPEPGGTLPGRVGPDRDGTWVAGLPVVACPSHSGARASARSMVDRRVRLMLRAVRDETMFVLPRVPETVPPALASILQKELANEAAFGARLENWLAQRTER